MMIYGVTLTNIDKWEAAARAIESFRRQVTPRLVLDDGRPLEDYGKAIDHFCSRGDVMLGISDSQPDAQLSTEAFAEKCEAVRRLWGGRPQIIYELRNEANGTWTAPDSGERLRAAAAILAGERTAVTLFLDETMASWWERYRTPVDYLFFSFYPTGWTDLRSVDWERLLETFAKDARVGVGIGEFGLEEWSRTVTQWTTRRVIEEICKIRLPSPRWLGGYFFWDFQSLAVPANRMPFQVMKEVWDSYGGA